MFTKKLSCDNFTGIIAPGTIINGDMRFWGTLRLQGQLYGDLLTHQLGEAGEAEATVIIDAGGEVDSKVVKVINAIIKGKLSCRELTVEGTLRIHAGAEVRCANIFYRALEIEPGALLHGCRLIHLDRLDANGPGLSN